MKVLGEDDNELEMAKGSGLDMTISHQNSSKMIVYAADSKHKAGGAFHFR